MTYCVLKVPLNPNQPVTVGKDCIYDGYSDLFAALDCNCKIWFRYLHI